MVGDCYLVVAEAAVPVPLLDLPAATALVLRRLADADSVLDLVLDLLAAS